jgi:pimeloyl-ACP methyl ester carboxylesterase
LIRRLGKTPPFRGPDGEITSGSIAEIAYRRLGGLDQWVMIRGESVANPPLILLHGGPGWSETGFFRYFNAPLEQSFTAVYWDQRGAGKSFDRAIPRSSMKVEQFISDLDELVDAVCERLGKRKVAIFGHSWGSALGVLYAAHFPEKVAGYVGSGQIGDWAAAESASYEFALAEAQRRGNRRAIRKLRGIGPPPYPAKAVFTERTWLSRFEGQMRPRALWKVGRAVLGAHESSIFELPRTWRGFRFSMDAMWAEVSRLNLIELAPALQMPVFFFLGRNDHWVSPATSSCYFDALAAPSKKLVWFEHSGHEPFVDEPAKFNAPFRHPLASGDRGDAVAGGSGCCDPAVALDPLRAVHWVSGSPATSCPSVDRAARPSRKWPRLGDRPGRPEGSRSPA